MEQRFAVLAQGEKPKIYKVPVNKMARLIDEFPLQCVEIFESLNDAKVSSSSPAAFIPPQKILTSGVAQSALGPPWRAGTQGVSEPAIDSAERA